ncbi:MAG: nicotinate-nucleotide adenylyltransferase [Thermoflexales bacterium]|nr:nicotinate-nucleotide adenylyltransferase [Thermoflexales bacterium]
MSRWHTQPPRLGILGGTFDPPHLAHLVLAEQARVQLELAQVLFCPAGEQPLKSSQAITPVEHRLAMIELAIAGQAGFRLSRVDIDRPGPHYTADTVALLHSSFPGHELYFLMGADSLSTVPKWYKPGRIIAQVRLIAARRPGFEPDIDQLEARLPGLRERLTWLDSPWLDIAASDIRRRVREGQSIRYLVPVTVEAYIRQQGLYLSTSP